MTLDPRPVLIRQIAALPRVIETLNTLAWRDAMSDALPEMDALVVEPPPPRQRASGEFFVGDLVELTRSRPLSRAHSAKPGARASVTRENYGVGWDTGRGKIIEVKWTDALRAGLRNIQSDGGYSARDFDLVRDAGVPEFEPTPAAVSALREATYGYLKFQEIAVAASSQNARNVARLVAEQYLQEIEHLRLTRPGLERMVID